MALSTRQIDFYQAGEHITEQRSCPHPAGYLIGLREAPAERRS